MFFFLSYLSADHRYLHSFPTRRSSDLRLLGHEKGTGDLVGGEPAQGAQGKRNLRLDHQRRVAAGEEDRKSTRLNSSHLGISYAVFCLKKKKDLLKRS